MTDRTRPLDEWLDKHHAKLLWTARITETYGVLGKHVLECWRINAAPLLVVRYNGGLEGWDVYTSHGGNDVKTTLEDAESRLLPAQSLPDEEPRVLATARAWFTAGCPMGTNDPHFVALHDALADLNRADERVATSRVAANIPAALDNEGSDD